LALTIDGALAHGLHWPAGSIIDAQAWYRDPQHPDGTASGLTSGSIATTSMD
jgi:hypothetical protein